MRRRPFGVVGAITPWNYPVMLAAWKIAPALLAGNTVVIKPSPYTPLSTLRLGEILRDVLPPGVLNVVSGGDALGAWITQHPLVRKISFTGSVATGKKVAAAAAPDLKRVTLELGGNDAAIVLPDADPAAIADKIFWGAFTNSGQVCSAIKRVYVHEDSFAALRDELTARAKSVKMGDGFEEGVQLGPINNRPQFERVIDLVDDAKIAGATITAGGAPRPGGGYFFEPTIVTGVAEGVRLVDEEQFGPALPLLTYRDVDDAVERANATSFGLSGSVWSSDVSRAARRRGPPGLRHRLGEQAPRHRPARAVRRREVVGDRRRERALGAARLHRDPDGQHREEIDRRPRRVGKRSFAHRASSRA